MKDPRSLIKLGNEDSEQIAVMAWAAKHRAVYPCLQWLHHIPNGGNRSAREGATFKAMGVKAGVSDLHLPFASRGFHGLMIEMKHSALGIPPHVKAKMISKEQQNYVDYLQANGYAAGVCYGYDEAVAAIAWYLEMKEW